ncbi:MAG: molybdopterin-dependent oxidoreductase [Actinomycetia bacterium]|nr:molybdopterin-dependent oxidoreductase [Actinomycetes bacterium]
MASAPGPESIVRGSCHHDCPDTCVWEVTVTNGRAVRLRGNADHPTTRAQLCPKVNRFIDRVYHPDRILTPLRRTGAKGDGHFEAISWPEGLDTIADRLQTITGTRGGEAILQYSFDGTQGVIQKGLMADRFFTALGASDVGRNLCGVTAWQGAADVSGLPYGIDPEDLRQARTIILWGTNTHLTNRHLWPVIDEARAAGATVVAIDPVRTSTAARSHHHLRIRPGTDVALVLGLVQVLDRDGLLDAEWLEDRTTGWVELRESAYRLPLDRIASITGIDEPTIEWLAELYATNRPSAVRVLVGPEHRERGRDIMRAIALLPSVTGAWRDTGGGLARSTQVYFETALSYPPPPDPPRRTFDMATLGTVLTDQTLDPPIEGLFVHNSNPAVICPDQERVLAGLGRPDLFTVVIEQFLTDTARHADIILPATTQIEHLDLGIAWGHLYLSLNQPAIPPRGEALSNTEIFRRLAAAMGLDDPSLADTDEELIRQLLDSDHPWLGSISYEHLERDTWARLAVEPGHRPNVDRPPDTPDQRLALGSIEYHAVTVDERFSLNLLTRKQHTKFLNTNYGGFAEHLPSEGEPTVHLDPTDAAARGIANGDRARVTNHRGQLTLRAVISEDLQPGLVAIPFGWWNGHTLEKRSVNVLVNPTPPADGPGSAALHDTWVEVEPVAEPPSE